MKKAIVEQVRQNGLAPNAPSWARATGQANPKSMDRIRDEHLAAYHFSSRECFDGCCTIKLALDGARLGEPRSISSRSRRIARRIKLHGVPRRCTLSKSPFGGGGQAVFDLPSMSALGLCVCGWTTHLSKSLGLINHKQHVKPGQNSTSNQVKMQTPCRPTCRTSTQSMCVSVWLAYVLSEQGPVLFQHAPEASDT